MLLHTFPLHSIDITLLDIVSTIHRGEVHGVIFVIDAADESRFEEVTEQYQALRKEPALRGKPLLLICNKSDCADFVGSDIMAMNLDLDVHPWCGPSTIIESSAMLKTKSSVQKGLWFLLNAVNADL